MDSTKVAEFLLDMSICGNSLEKHEAQWKGAGNRDLTKEERAAVRNFVRNGIDGFTLGALLLGQWLETTALVEKMRQQEDL